MRVLAAIAIVFASLSLAGCESQKAPAPGDKGVEVHAPGVDVKKDKDGLDINAPGVNIDVEKKK